MKITDENINIARKLGKILSKQGISTNFTDDLIRGKYFDYSSMKTISTELLNTATQILANPELFEDVEPDIYYYEKMYPSRKHFAFDLKKRLLSYYIYFYLKILSRIFAYINLISIVENNLKD